MTFSKIVSFHSEESIPRFPGRHAESYRFGLDLQILQIQPLLPLPLILKTLLFI